MNKHNEMDWEITAQAIRGELARILASDAFARSPRMQRFLEFIVEETLAGRGNQLGEYTIGTAVFDRGPDFEPALDPIVRNDARRLRLKLFECYRQYHPRAGDRVIIDVPKGGYTPVFLPGSRNIGGDGIPPRECPRRLAVLPFEELSAASDGRTCGRALSLSLTAKLTNMDGLETIAHDYLPEKPIREAAAELQLSHVISGGVLNSGDGRRVIINLVRVSDGAQLWAREYDFRIDEAITNQSQIVANVLQEVTARLGSYDTGPRRLALVA